MLKELSMNDLMQKLSSSDPTPGGGSAAALAAWQGASLIIMFCGLSLGKEKFKHYETVLQKADKEARTLAEQLKKAVDEDTEAFDQVMKAFRLPKDTEQEKSKRKAAIQKAMRLAAEVPLTVSKNCLSLLKICQEIVDKGNPNSITDLGVGCLLAHSAMEGAILNVKINLSAIKDEDYVKKIAQQISPLKENGEKIKAEVTKKVEKLIK
jgi:formiminotetrahydrofolate cyclodeaminase